MEMLAAGMDFEDWTARVGDEQPALWTLGHLAATRRHLARSLGDELEPRDWERKFHSGRRPLPGLPLPDYPAVDDLLGEYGQAGELLVERLEFMERVPTPEGGWRIPSLGAVSKTSDAGDLAGGLNFYCFNEAYNLGQIGLIRRMRGLSSPF